MALIDSRELPTMKVLVIEDDLSIAALEKKILETAGHEVIVVGNLHDACDLQISIESQELLPRYKPFDFVILDLKLPVSSVPGTYHDMDEVLSVINEKFDGTAVVVISAFIDKDCRQLAAKYNMLCLDKSLLKESQEFLNILLNSAEASKKMRTMQLVHHLSGDAYRVATENTAKMKPYEDKKDSCEVSPKERAEARLYLMGGMTFIVMPYLVIGYTMYAQAVLNITEPIPYYMYILLFCAIGLSSIFGILPWVMKFFQTGVSIKMHDQKDDAEDEPKKVSRRKK